MASDFLLLSEACLYSCIHMNTSTVSSSGQKPYEYKHYWPNIHLPTTSCEYYIIKLTSLVPSPLHAHTRKGLGNRVHPACPSGIYDACRV